MPGEGAERRKAKQKRVVSEQVTFARGLRRDSTPAEKKLWHLLREASFADAGFRRQVPIGPFVADFLSYSCRIVVEADGSQHSDERDGARDAWFRAHGWRVLRFRNEQILDDIQLVGDVIWAKCGKGEMNR